LQLIFLCLNNDFLRLLQDGIVQKVSIDSSTKIFIAVIGIVFIVAILKLLSYILLPFTIAYILYFLFSPLNDFLYEKKIPGIIIILFDILIIGVIAFSITRLLVESFAVFDGNTGVYTTKLNEVVRSVAASVGIKDPSIRSFTLQKAIGKLDFLGLATGAINSIVPFAGSILLILFFFVFIVSGHHSIYLALKRRYQKPAEKKTGENPAHTETGVININMHNTFQEITEQIQKYIVTKIAVNLLAGILVGVAALLLKIDFPFLWGVMAFVLNFIPTIGSVGALVLPTLMALIQYGSIGYTGLTAGIIAAIQTVCFNLLEPLMIGKRLDLNPIVILLSVLLWGYVWGITGMILAVPLTAIIKIIISNSKDENVQLIVDLMGRN
jgi:predicted PurR-regulated permease PerM